MARGANVKWIMAASIMALTTAMAQAEDVIYENAQVWQGDGFAAKTLAVRDDFFVDPAMIADTARRVDLAGAYLVPPYANAHHHITNANEATSAGFLEVGVFYAWNPNTIVPRDISANQAFFAQTQTYDVRQSLGGITEPLGHPEKLYVENLSQWVYRGWELDDFLGNAFHYGRTPEEIDASLDLLLEQGADFVKTYLLYSEDYAERSGDAAYYGAAGLNPENFPYLVEAAHRRGLPVVVHVQTRHDARVAAAAGADMLGHLPGYSVERDPDDIAATRLTAEDAAAIAEAGMSVVPTYRLVRSSLEYSAVQSGDPVDTELANQLFAVQADNLQRLQAAGVPILTGTDGPAEIVSEVEHWIEIGGLTPVEAISASFQTGSYLFPDRPLGRLEPGYEASFLALDGNPLEDTIHMLSIRQRIKQGELITLPVADETED